jgi:apolipoprotein N-acyltransferase
MRRRVFPFLLVLLSGVLTAFSFPKLNLPFFAWISLIPLFFALLKKNLKQSFFLGLAAGFSFYAILLYWIPAVPAHYGNLSPLLSFLVYLILILFLALYWAFFCLVFKKIYLSFPKLSFYLAPFLWVAFEYILTYFLTGFPWGLLGYSQVKNIYFIQLASLTGVFGLSFLLVLFQSLFVFSITYRKRLPFFLALGLLVLVHLGGFLSLKKVTLSRDSFTASIIQGNVSSDIYWDAISEEEIQQLFQEHLELTQNALASGSRLIIWPEFTVPLCFSCPQSLYFSFKKTLIEFVKSTGVTLLLGTNETTGPPGDLKYHNTAFCLSPDQPITQYYKMHLVPFGEYTPYKKIFSFIEKMTHAIGDITPGANHVLHSFRGIKFGSPICYEIIFPELVRKFAKKGANFLVTITNDGWYGKSSAPYQHFSIAVFRAVENRRFLLRAATTGISGIIDPYGRILHQSQIETRTFLTARVTPSSHLTFYTRCGDLLPFFSLTLGSIFFILSLIIKKNERKS